MTRDHIDYERNNVYIWKKPQFFSGRSRKTEAKKQVSFSDLENDLINNTLAITASDSSPEHTATPTGQDRPISGRTTTGNPCRSSGRKQKKKPTQEECEKEEGSISDTKSNHYSLRGRTPR